jgi:hypothetical protein
LNIRIKNKSLKYYLQFEYKIIKYDKEKPLQLHYYYYYYYYYYSEKEDETKIKQNGMSRPCSMGEISNACNIFVENIKALMRREENNMQRILKIWVGGCG